MAVTSKISSPYLTGEVRAAIKACQGNLSQSATARKFGVSRRTVGRIFHGGELSTSSDSLRQQVADLTKLVKDLGAQLAAQKVPQRFRPSLDPDFQVEIRKSHRSDFSSPYRDSPGMDLVRVYGFDVHVPYDWRNKARDAWFVSQNPVSPECTVYPYPQTLKRKTQKIADEQPDYRDPPAGVSCDCEECCGWRLGLAFEHAIRRAMPHAISDYALFKTGYRR